MENIQDQLPQLEKELEQLLWEVENRPAEVLVDDEGEIIGYKSKLLSIVFETRYGCVENLFRVCIDCKEKKPARHFVDNMCKKCLKETLIIK